MHMPKESQSGTIDGSLTGKHSIRISTSSGNIIAVGEAIAQRKKEEAALRKDEETAYHRDGDPGRVIELKSTNGNIYME